MVLRHITTLRHYDTFLLLHYDTLRHYDITTLRHPVNLRHYDTLRHITTHYDITTLRQPTWPPEPANPPHIAFPRQHPLSRRGTVLAFHIQCGCRIIPHGPTSVVLCVVRLTRGVLTRVGGGFSPGPPVTCSQGGGCDPLEKTD